MAAKAAPKAFGQTPKWIWPAYYSLCVYWLISGIASIVDAYHTAVTPVTIKFLGMSETSTPGFSNFGVILGLALGFFTVLVGVGLLARVEFARGVANFLAGLNIIFGLLAIAGTILGAGMATLFGIALLIKHTVDVISGGMTIYLIGETEKHAPNF